MTAGKVMSAIKVDMCRRRQQQQQQSTNSAAPNSASIIVASDATVASPVAPNAAGLTTLPNILDVMRAQRQRRPNGVRTCLFGVPEPGSTQKLYGEMLQQQRQYMLQRYQFDMVTEKYVGPAEVPAPTTEDRLQQRLLAEHQTARDAKADSPSATDGSHPDNAGPSSTSASAGRNGDIECEAAGARVKPTKSSASLRPSCSKSGHQAKPYDRPTPAAMANDVRPITEFFRKSKKTCPTAAAMAAKLQPTCAEAEVTTAAEV